MYNLNKLGTDTEVFLKRNGSYVPAIGLIGGTKSSPRPLDNKGSMVQEDNVMLEFNTIPASTEEDWVFNINIAMVKIFEELSEKGLTMAIEPSVEFPTSALKHPQAREIGCEGDFNAWTMQENPHISANKLKNLRVSGGHIHISYTVQGELPNSRHHTNFVRALDLSLGIPSIILDTDTRRREFYGKAGSFRIKAKDRIEYRVLSNFWIKNDNLKKWVFNNVVWAIRQLNGRFQQLETSLFFEEKSTQNLLINAINTGDKETAMQLISGFNIPMP